MLNLEWVAHRSGVHQMFPSTVEIRDTEGNALVTTYAVHRPDGNWSLLLVNRDQSNAHTVRVMFEDFKGRQAEGFAGPVSFATFGSEQYVWQDNGPGSHADPDGPPAGRTLAGDRQASYTLPKASITVLRGHVQLGNNQVRSSVP
jgi:hypothetical protein